MKRLYRVIVTHNRPLDGPFPFDKINAIDGIDAQLIQVDEKLHEIIGISILCDNDILEIVYELGKFVAACIDNNRIITQN